MLVFLDIMEAFRRVRIVPINFADGSISGPQFEPRAKVLNVGSVVNDTT